MHHQQEGHDMDDASHESLRHRLNAAAGTAEKGDWAEVERLARSMSSQGSRTAPLTRRGLLTRRRILVFVLGTVTALAPPAFAVGYLVLRSTPITAPPVTLPTLPAGWTVVTDSPQDLKPTSNTNVETLITSWRYRPTQEGPASVIPPGGTMISVTLSRDQAYHARKVNLCEKTAKLAQYPPKTPPLTLPSTTTETFDGAPHVTELRVLGRYHDSYNFEVRVDIDTRRAVKPRWSVAEAIVRGLVFPKWPSDRSC
jgi:hypothetical protein